MKLFVFGILLALSSAQQEQIQSQTAVKKPLKRSYVCPPNFVRLSHRCYYFSRDVATWQDAYFQCRDLHSNLAIIRNSNQDKLIRRTLSKKTLEPLERWLGGLYDWEQMRWKWASSGKPLIYQGFSRMEAEDKDKLRWHCIIIDPKLQFKWNTRSCVERKHFICHTKIKIVTSKGKKKLLRQYHVDKYNRLNEIPVPTLPEDVNLNNTRLKEHYPNPYAVPNQYASRAKEKRRRRKNRGKKGQETYKFENATLPVIVEEYDMVQSNQIERRRRKKSKDDERMKWKTYLKNDSRKNPLHPKPIVEEFNYVK